MADKVRLTATVDADVADEVRRLADGMRLSVARLLGVLIEAAVRSSGDSLAMIGNTLDGLIAADQEHDGES